MIYTKNVLLEAIYTFYPESEEILHRPLDTTSRVKEFRENYFIHSYMTKIAADFFVAEENDREFYGSVKYHVGKIIKEALREYKRTGTIVYGDQDFMFSQAENYYFVFGVDSLGTGDPFPCYTYSGELISEDLEADIRYFENLGQIYDSVSYFIIDKDGDEAYTIYSDNHKG